MPAIPGTGTYLLVAQRNGVLVLTVRQPQLSGDRAAAVLGRELDQAVAESEATSVVVDLRNVQSLSSGAFRPLLGLRRDLARRGGRLVLCGLSSAVASVFQATRMMGGYRSSADAFEVQPDLASALASLSEKP